MKKDSAGNHGSTVRKEYDFSRGRRGKYARRFAAASNVVVLDQGVSRVFTNSASANGALRQLIRIATKDRRAPAR